MSSPRPADLEYIGQLVDGRWEILRVLGVGGMGSVYQARDRKTGDVVALKRLRPEFMRDSEVVGRFLREGQSGAQMVHENIVNVRRIGQDPRDGSLYLVQEFLTGQDLRQRLTTGGRMSPEDAIAMIAPIIDGLACAHSYGVVHRDIKPANIFLASLPDGRVVPKVIDFGVSKILGPLQDGLSKTRTGIAVGTPQYMSPEQLRGERGLDERTDIFSVAVVLYMTLTGKHPFQAADAAHVMLNILTVDPPRVDEIAPHLSRELGEVVAHGMAKDRAHRFATMAEFHAALVSAPVRAPLGSVSEVSDIADSRTREETFVGNETRGPAAIFSAPTVVDSSPVLPAPVLPSRPSAHPSPRRDRILLATGVSLFALAIGALAIALVWHAGASRRPTPATQPVNAPAAPPPASEMPSTQLH